MRSRVLAVIPARLASTRLPEKALLDRTGKPLIVHVLEAVAACRAINHVVVATDHARILDAVKHAGGDACLTAESHRSGTDRLAEVVAGERYADYDLIVNVQGDEPEVEPAALSALVEAMRPLAGKEPTAAPPQLATLATPLPKDRAADPAAVKVVCDLEGRALYFSRAPIPHDRDDDAPAAGEYLLHLGVYAYTRAALLRFASLPPSPLEQREQLEQLRALEHGIPIHVVITPHGFKGIDTEADYAAFCERVQDRAAK